jgi:hypothetical protein
LLTVLLAVLAVLAGGGLAEAEEHSWQSPHARVLPTGDLEWAPTPFRYTPGATIRYIDFADGDDDNPGTRARPWKHHPWDAAATGLAGRGVDGPAAYVFKGGVTYRGALRGKGISGAPGEPIRLTRDPSWGDGPALLVGSTRIADGWSRASEETAPKGMPEPGKVWYIDLKTPEPVRTLWLLDGETITRLPLARTPNWQIETYDDIKSQWWQWADGGKVRPGMQGIDPVHLTESPDYYKDAMVYSEWGIVMSTPVALPVTDFDPDKKALTFEGFFTPRTSDRISKGMRYYLEDKPHYLDDAGEWYFQKKGDDGGRLFLRLPGDANPNDARIEVGRHRNLIDLRDVKHLHISGLSFRFTSVDELGKPGFKIYEDEHDVSVVRMQGSVVDAAVTHCTFEHINNAVGVDVDSAGAVGEDILIADNDIRYTDHSAIEIENSYAQHGSTKPDEPTRINGLKILRNNIYMTGMRPHRGGHGHTVTVSFPESAEIAGNVLDRTWGSGLFVFGGKPSGAKEDRPFSRIIIHHNKATNTLLNTNDWGGIECWQGGPFYVYNNISGNPGGYRHWRWLRQKDKRDSRLGHVGTRFGHAYYMDGAFKNYHFNNIAWGKENDLRSPLMNTAAFQEIHGFQNDNYNNTIYRFGAGSRRQTPEPGRNLFLGSIWSDISDYVFAHGPIPGVKEVNAADVGKVGEEFDYTTVGYANNVFYDISKHLSTLEAGEEAGKVEAMRESLEALGAYATNVGVMAKAQPLRDPAGGDFRPAEGSPAIDFGVKPFVPWSLYATVGEWMCFRNRHDPTKVIDSHWYMSPLHLDRTTYEHIPTWTLHGVNVTDECYVAGPLEDWTRGAIRLNGSDQYLHTELPGKARVARVAAEVDKPVTVSDYDGWLTITHPSAIVPGRTFTVTVKTNPDVVARDKTVQAFLGARKRRGWGGTHAMAKEIRGFKASQEPLTFTMTPKMADGLREYVVVVHYGDKPGWDNKDAAARVTVPFRPARALAEPDRFHTPDIDTGSLIVEAYAKVESGSAGVLVEKTGKAGYSLIVQEDGRVALVLAGADGSRSKAVTRSKLADGRWHHLLAEVDRDAGRSTLYVDGKADGLAKAPAKGVSLSNDGEMTVGGTPDGRNLAVTIDYLRVTRGSLADSRTTIDELRAWQFDGPFLRDFTGRAPVGARRDAGAIEASGGTIGAR